MRGNSKFLLFVLALTFITSSFAHIDIEQDIEGDFDIRPDDDFNLEGDFDFLNLEIEDIDSEGLKDITLQRGLVLVLYTDKTSEEKNEEFEKFFKTLAPFINSEALDLDLSLVRIGSEEAAKLSSHFKPPYYPALVLFDHQRKFVYENVLELVDFFNWLTPTVSRELIDLNDKESLEKFIESDDSLKLIAFYSSNHNNELEILNNILLNSYLVMLDIRKVGLCSDNCPNQYNGQTFSRPSLVLFRNYKNMEKVVVLDRDLTNMTTLYEFCTLESVPPVLIFDEVNMTKMFEDVYIGQIILILDPEVDNTEVLKAVEESAYHNKDKDPKEERLIHAVYYNRGEDDGINWFFNVKNLKTFPKLFLTQPSHELNKILKFENIRDEPITFNLLRDFINDFHNKRLKRYFISEEEPTSQQETNLKKLVGSTFTPKVLDSRTNYIVFACDDFSNEPCKSRFEGFEGVAKLGSMETYNLKFGYIDVSKNEVDFDLSEGLPRLIFYKSEEKSSPNYYKDNEFTKKDILDWIKDFMPEVKVSIGEEKASTGTDDSGKQRFTSIEL